MQNYVFQIDEEAQQRLLTAVTVLKMCSSSAEGSRARADVETRDNRDQQLLARGDSGCFAWTDTESELDLASVTVVHRDTAKAGLFVNKDFEEVPSFEEEGAGGVDVEEENQCTDFMAKFANTLALFESEPKVGKQQFLINPKTPFPQTRSIPVIGAKRRPPCSSTIALDDLLGIKSC